jgi:two-component system, response regulator PdtaR
MRSRTKITLLVVEDNAIIRGAAVAVLQHAGYEPLEADCAANAVIALIARPDVKLVFTDVTMPGPMDGAQLSRFIRCRWPQLPMIVTSGNFRSGDHHLPDRVPFIEKPYEPSTLLRAISGMLTTPDGGASGGAQAA